MKPLTRESRKALIENLRLLANKIEAGMVLEVVKSDWHVIDTGMESKWFSSWDPAAKEGWIGIQERPKVVNYTLDISFQPHEIEPKFRKKKKKSKKDDRSKFRKALKAIAVTEIPDGKHRGFYLERLISVRALAEDILRKR